MNKIFYTFVLSALVLLSVQCNPKSQESDEQLENDSIIEYAELLSITCHDDYTDVKISNPWDSAGCCTDISSFPRHKTFHRIYRKEPS